MGLPVVQQLQYMLSKPRASRNRNPRGRENQTRSESFVGTEPPTTTALDTMLNSDRSSSQDWLDTVRLWFGILGI